MDFSECFSLTYNEMCVVHCSAGYTGVGDKNTPEFIGDSDDHLEGSLECAEASLELSTVRVLAKCRVEALSPGNLSTRRRVCHWRASIRRSMRISNSRGPAQWIYARARLLDLELGARMQSTPDGNFTVHPVSSENVSWRTLVVVLDQELHPNQTVYVLIDARAVLDSSGKPFVGLAGIDFNLAVAEQVVVPNEK